MSKYQFPMSNQFQNLRLKFGIGYLDLIGNLIFEISISSYYVW